MDHSAKLNIDLNAKNNFGTTAFMFTCMHGHSNIVQLILKHSEVNIDLNAKENSGFTGFMFACMSGHKKVIKLLFNTERNIDLNAKSNVGKTAFTEYNVESLLLEE